MYLYLPICSNRIVVGPPSLDERHSR